MRGFQVLQRNVPTRVQAALRQSMRPAERASWLLCLLTACLCSISSANAQTTFTYFHTDPLGSVVAKTDESGNVIERYDYEPYGTVIGGHYQRRALVHRACK